MKPRSTAFALFAVFIALAISAKDRIAYEFESLSDFWQYVWVIGGIIAVTALAAYFLSPFVDIFFFIS